MKKSLVLSAALALVAAPVLATHANPWATENDTVLAKNHDANQAKSIGTPGEDEMRGVMTQNANGKLGDAGRSGGGASGQPGGLGGNGGHGAGRN